MSWKQKLPNYLTYSRIFFAIPITVLLFYPDFACRFAAAFLFVVASITDYFDGYFARRYSVVSAFGKLMVPVGDKILVTATLIMLVHVQKIHPYLVILLLSRDLLIGGIRAAAAADQLVIAAQSSGKWKTALQMVCIPTLILSLDLFGIPFTMLAISGLWLSVVLSTFSGYQYFAAYQKAQTKSTPN